MDTSGWRDRLRREIEAQKRTLRSVSMKAGLGESYVSGILNEMKDPSVERLAAVCNELHVSLSAILFGTTDTPEQEEFLNLLQRAPDPVRESVLHLLRATATESISRRSSADPQT
jgi:transcriptional regulator with XRE-family HTH domain